MVSLFFFFFQAEDGIRDYKVTGVQTCALPISEETAQGDDAAGVADLDRDGTGGGRGEDGGEEVEHARRDPPRDGEQDGADQRCRQDDHETHPRSSRRRSTAIESCSRRIRRTTPSMINTITDRSRKTPASTIPGRP